MNESLLKRTVVVTLALLGASVAWVGGVSLVVVTAVDHVMGGSSSASDAPAASAAAPAHAESGRPRATSTTKPNG